MRERLIVLCMDGFDRQLLIAGAESIRTRRVPNRRYGDGNAGAGSDGYICPDYCCII